ncbi:hypothetical protein L581_0010 [Serratia fonticola AU-AP2C]|nr:hypothetical protein L581_0010 [Serratia fonticola AU-AP2C]
MAFSIVIEHAILEGCILKSINNLHGFVDKKYFSNLLYCNK